MSRTKTLWLLAGLVLVLGLALVAFVPGLVPYSIVDTDQTNAGTGETIPLQPGETAGQTFVAQHGGLMGIELLLSSPITTPVTLTWRLRTGPESGVDLASGSTKVLRSDGVTSARPSFDPIADSHGRYYYVYMEASGPGIQIPIAAREAYLDGSAYRNHEPVDAQTSFRLVYNTAAANGSRVLAVLGWLPRLAAAAFLFVVPGWALLVWLLPRRRRLGWAEVLALAIGTSLALYPLLLLWTHVVGLHPGRLLAWAPGAAGSAALLGRWGRAWRPGRRKRTVAPQDDGKWDAAPESERRRPCEGLWPGLALLGVLALVLATRLLVLRRLETPLWGDGYQHTLIAQLIVDQGGLFSSWEPYAELETLTYHFGFHGNVAVLHWLTGMPVVSATLWMGQLLNAAAALALYPLAVRITGSRWAGVWAVLLAGLLAPMPMEYVNWARYTQLAGQVILPVAMWLTWDLTEPDPGEPDRGRAGRRPWGVVALTALAAAGLAVTHYRVLLYYALFCLCVAPVYLRRTTWRYALPCLTVAGLGAVLLALPWFVNTFGGQLLSILGYQITTAPAQASTFDWQYNSAGDLTTYLAPVWWVVTLIGLGVGLWQRNRGVLLMGAWWLALLVATNPAWFALPGMGVITNFALFISVYLPAGLLTGVAADRCLRFLLDGRPAALRLRVYRLARRMAPALVAIGLVALGAWGAAQRMRDLDVAGSALVTRPDVRAADWIRENTPLDARFLVNAFSAYGGSSVVGSDAGWWLPLLAGRSTTLPPLTYASERGPVPDYRIRVNGLAQMVSERGPDDPGVLEQLRAQGVTHVYIGQRQGRVNYAGPGVLDAGTMRVSPHFRVIYHQDGVWVFEIVG